MIIFFFLLFVCRFESNQRMNEICDKGNKVQQYYIDVLNEKMNNFDEMKANNLQEQNLLTEKK